MLRRPLRPLLMLTALLGSALLGLPTVHAAGEVNLYSSRQEDLIKPLLDRFTKDTGIKVNLVSGKDDAIIERLRAEGANSPADLLFTADAGRLYRAQSLGLLQPVQSAVLNEAIPAGLREADGHWFGLSMRARPIMVVKGKVTPAQLSTYAALADKAWKGKICSRSSDSIYNQSLVAALIAHQGAATTETWARGLVANFARPPAGGDRDQILAAAAGVCDIAIANTYYLGGLLASPNATERDAAAKMEVIWPDQQGNGTHVNIAGAGVTKAARNRDNAVKLLEYLAGDDAQRWYTETNNEYPVKPGIAWGKTLEGWGRFKADNLAVEQLGKNNAEAVRLMDRAGWK